MISRVLHNNTQPGALEQTFSSSEYSLSPEGMSPCAVRPCAHGQEVEKLPTLLRKQWGRESFLMTRRDNIPTGTLRGTYFSRYV